MQSSSISQLFPFIQRNVQLFDGQNRFLKKIILTGKICAIEQAANLFSFTEKTIETFSSLQEELIPLLIDENLKKHTEELRSKAQISIDILIRNLFERTADVGFLATDESIITYLKENKNPEQLRQRLIEYTLKYSVYNEIIITDDKGNIRLNINENNALTHSDDPLITEALHYDGYIERYAQTDLFISQPKTLLFAQRIVENQQTLGVLILCFRFDDEMSHIFSSLLNPNEHILFTNGKDVIASSDHQLTSLNDFLRIDTEAPYVYRNGSLYVSAKTKGYEGYHGAKWNSIAYKNGINHSRNLPSTASAKIKCTLNDNIRSIIMKADDVIEDLSDVIINGELIAAKERVYVLTPVLDNLRNISTSILETIKESVTNLEDTIMEGLVFDVQASAKLAINIMDRNLYERANDCRWWAMTPTFEEELSQETPDIKRISDVLHYINSLYTVYTNLFIYDTDSMIIAASSDQTIIGKKVSGDYISKTLSNKNSQNYFVSPFENNLFYNDSPTYIYSSTIRSNGITLGGIGIVFDAYPQFNAMLEDSFSSSKKGFSCFIDRKGVVIATTHPEMKLLQQLPLENEILRFSAEESTHCFTLFEDKKYLVGIALSEGYREYKTQDNYKNDLLSLTFVEY
ncbi:MAG: hypothetical protein Q8M43_13835 [Sulfuricurvum sp.]|uniref:hypothetical protein n=1 Tax=Sulfuricurvum sp. TaxID=2025608 RepID=UPI00273537CF|nr:hypothetical protein [Sulfuricurvum sp.]MDP3293101.1 hypothetical protein [Sulfuricurvum sp.]